jgi:hypothetical protein
MKTKGLSGHKLKRRVTLYKAKKIRVAGGVAGLVGIYKPKGPSGGYANPTPFGPSKSAGGAW